MAEFFGLGVEVELTANAITLRFVGAIRVLIRPTTIWSSSSLMRSLAAYRYSITLKLVLGDDWASWLVKRSTTLPVAVSGLSSYSYCRRWHCNIRSIRLVVG